MVAEEEDSREGPVVADGWGDLAAAVVALVDGGWEDLVAAGADIDAGSVAAVKAALVHSEEGTAVVV